MQQERQVRMQDGAQGQNGTSKPNASKKRHGGRVALSLDVDKIVRDALREKAAAAGVSMAQYVSNALAMEKPAYATAAIEIAQPLTQLAYIIAQVDEALRSSDTARASTDMRAAKQLLAMALKPLQDEHATEYHANERRRAGGWSG